MKYRFSPLILITVPMVGLMLDARTGMDDYFVLSFSVCFGLAYAFLLYKLHCKCDYVLKKHMAKAMLTLTAASAAFICVAYFGYLNEPFQVRTVSSGGYIRYQYHHWTFGVFFLTHGLFFLYLLTFSIFKILTGKVR